MRPALARARPGAAAVGLAWALASALGLGAACNTPPELQLAIRLPAGTGLFGGVARLDLSANRNGVTLAQASFPASATSVALGGVSHGAGTVVRLDGIDGNGNVNARGLTCPADFEGPLTAPLYFAPVNFFAPTASPPLVERQRPLAYTVEAAIPGGLAVGDVLLLGGASRNGTVLAASERFVPGTATFSAYDAGLAFPRWKAESALLPGVGLLITGGVDATGQVLSAGELLRSGSSKLETLDAGFDARVGHRLVALSSGAAFLSGGSHSDGGAPLTSTQTIFVGANSGYLVKAGPDLAEARREHAAVAAGSAVVVFGGYGATGQLLASIESMAPLSADEAPPHRSSTLSIARAEATASLLSDGSILVVGGVGADGPLATAELWNPYTQTTTTYTMVSARVGHSATVISGDRVLVAGGTDATGAPVATVELFSATTDVGFLSERSLRAPRTHHLAHPLCDTTVLMSGGSSGASAELYTPTPAN